MEREKIRPPMFHRWARHSTYLWVITTLEKRGSEDPEVQEYTQLVREEVAHLDAYYGHTNWHEERKEV